VFATGARSSRFEGHVVSSPAPSTRHCALQIKSNQHPAIAVGAGRRGVVWAGSGGARSFIDVNLINRLNNSQLHNSQLHNPQLHNSQLQNSQLNIRARPWL
jgi:hypothetical protein